TEPQEIFLVNLVQDHCRRLLDDLVLEVCNGKWSLASVRLWYVRPPRRLRPICSSLNPIVQVLDLSIKICLVGSPRLPIDTGGCVTPEGVECCPHHLRIYVVEERGELLLLSLPCGLPYAVQRRRHTFPVLCPARAVLIRIPLGSRPSLHLLRRRQTGFVRKLHRYYGGIRLLMIVHHRLRLLTFPMRTSMANHAGQSRGLPVPVQEASMHARVFDRAGSNGHLR